MNTSYIHVPPPVTRLPKFVYKWYPQQVLGALMRWADNEYNARIDYAVKVGDLDLARILYREWSGMRILAGMEGFRWVVAQYVENVDSWNQLDRKTRSFVRRAFEMYELLRNGRR